MYIPSKGVGTTTVLVSQTLLIKEELVLVRPNVEAILSNTENFMFAGKTLRVEYQVAEQSPP
jgi:hypothetical protein